jgi:hypothetical protein
MASQSAYAQIAAIQEMLKQMTKQLAEISAAVKKK